jgi:hypothetical protein
LARVIDSAKQNPAELRYAIYEIARIKLQQEGWSKNPPLEDSEMRRLTVALETAIERVEAISLREQDGLIQDLSKEAPREAPQETLLLIDQELKTDGNNSLVSKLSIAARHIGPTLLHYRQKPSSFSLLRASAVALALVAVFYAAFSVQLGVLKSRPALQGTIETLETNVPPDRTSMPKSKAIANGPKSVRPDRTDESPAVIASPVPRTYGVYANSNGELFELDPLPGRAPDQRIFMSAIINTPSRTVLPNGRVSFLAYRRELATSAPERVSVRVIASVKRAMAFDARGKASVTKVEGIWAMRNVAYNYRVAPLTEQPEMLVMESDLANFDLPAGRYGMVLKDVVYDFTVAGPITETAQCLERTVATNGTFYSECKR